MMPLLKFERFLKWAKDNAATPEAFDLLVVKHTNFIESVEKAIAAGDIVIQKGTVIGVRLSDSSFEGKNDLTGEPLKTLCWAVTFELPIGPVRFLAPLNSEGKYYHYQLIDEQELVSTPSSPNTAH